jgi:hypothetical protein
VPSKALLEGKAGPLILATTNVGEILGWENRDNSSGDTRNDERDPDFPSGFGPELAFYVMNTDTL